MSSLTGPPSASWNPLQVIVHDMRMERAATLPFPPGDTRPSIRHTEGIVSDPLPMLLDLYERHGPVFTIRIFHQKVVFMIGPEANHYILLAHPENFSWRDGHFRDLIPFLGDGLLTIDGDFHRRSRQIMLPAFHSKQIAASIDVMLEETDRALSSWRIGTALDFYDWSRRLALRIAMRAIFGLDPDGEQVRRIDAAKLFTDALEFYSRHALMRIARGPGTPLAKTMKARAELDRLVYHEIAERRATGRRGNDVLSLLLDACDEDGAGLSDVHIRDEVMTLMFAGHDTTTSTLAFMFYELARQPDLIGPLIAEQDEVLRDNPPTAEQLSGRELPELEKVLEETLRKYPPAWIGPRRAIENFEFLGVPVPGGAPVSYSSWVSHHLPHVFPDPERFDPSRFDTDAKAALPKGAYVPFGGGSRTCIGMRFGQLEIRTIATLLLSRYTLLVREGYELRVRQMPTIGPKGGLPVVVGERASAASPAAVAA